MIIKVDEDMPNDAVRAEYMPGLLAVGYSQEDAALIFDLAWQASVEAQKHLASVVNRVPEPLHLSATMLASVLAVKSFESLLHHAGQVSIDRTIAALTRRIIEGK